MRRISTRLGWLFTAAISLLALPAACASTDATDGAPVMRPMCAPPIPELGSPDVSAAVGDRVTLTAHIKPVAYVQVTSIELVLARPGSTSTIPEGLRGSSSALNPDNQVAKEEFAAVLTSAKDLVLTSTLSEPADYPVFAIIKYVGKGDCALGTETSVGVAHLGDVHVK